ncbi:hypothetical protein PR048_004902 [Dryococelus australis]|uniref:Uncharacterized protein n=1 Tax=Dryococelus australis TaxID=614101 RepID=A0ABQ9I6Q0_9NEOP|nr:hypothetical protein PR048_004902 [Dryococelus australis]
MSSSATSPIPRCAESSNLKNILASRLHLSASLAGGGRGTVMPARSCSCQLFPCCRGLGGGRVASERVCLEEGRIQVGHPPQSGTTHSGSSRLVRATARGAKTVWVNQFTKEALQSVPKDIVVCFLAEDGIDKLRKLTIVLIRKVRRENEVVWGVSVRNRNFALGAIKFASRARSPGPLNIQATLRRPLFLHFVTRDEPRKTAASEALSSHLPQSRVQGRVSCARSLHLVAPEHAQNLKNRRDRGSEVVRLLASCLGEPGSIPSGVTPQIFACENCAGRCRWSAGFLGGSPISTALSFRLTVACLWAYSRYNFHGNMFLPITLRPFLISGTIVVAQPIRVKLGKNGAVPECKGRGKREILEKTRRPTSSSGTVPKGENPGATPPGIEPGSFWYEAIIRNGWLCTYPDQSVVTPTLYSYQRFRINIIRDGYWYASAIRLFDSPTSAGESYDSSGDRKQRAADSKQQRPQFARGEKRTIANDYWNNCRRGRFPPMSPPHAHHGCVTGVDCWSLAAEVDRVTAAQARPYTAKEGEITPPFRDPPSLNLHTLLVIPVGVTLDWKPQPPGFIRVLSQHPAPGIPSLLQHQRRRTELLSTAEISLSGDSRISRRRIPLYDYEHPLDHGPFGLTTNSWLLHSGSKLDPRSDLISTQKTVAPFELRAGQEIEMKLISNRRNCRFEILIRDQQPSSTNIDESEIQNHEISLVQHFYIETKIKLDPSSELGSFDLGSGKMLVQPGIAAPLSLL